MQECDLSLVLIIKKKTKKKKTQKQKKVPGYFSLLISANKNFHKSTITEFIYIYIQWLINKGFLILKSHHSFIIVHMNISHSNQNWASLEQETASKIP